MNLSDFIARRAAQVPETPRRTCTQCRKALPTCYCHMLRPFEAPVAFVILQHCDEARNAIATARMAHLSMTNSRLVVGNHFHGHAQVEALIADPSRRNLLLYPSADALPIEQIFAEPAGLDPRPPVFWVMDAKWSKVPKMLRLSPNVRAIPRVRFRPERESAFQIRRQPDPAYLSTIETVYLVIERYLNGRGEASPEHHTLIDVFQYLVQQQLGFVDGHDIRHRASRNRRAARRRSAADGSHA